MKALNDMDKEFAGRGQSPVAEGEGVPSSPAGALRVPGWLLETLGRRDFVEGLLEDLDFLPGGPPDAGGGGTDGAGEGPGGLSGRSARAPAALRFMASASAELKGGRTLHALGDAVLGSRKLLALLALSWHERSGSYPFPGPFEPGSWRQLLFALLEMLRSGRVRFPVNGRILEAALEPAAGSGAPRPPASLVGAAGALADAARARRILTETVRAGRQAVTDGTCAAGTVFAAVGAADPGVPAGFFAAAAEAGNLWRAFSADLESRREALKSISLTGAGGAFPGLGEVSDLDPLGFAERCLEELGGWVRVSALLHDEALRRMDALVEKARILEALTGALDALGATWDASVTRVLSQALEGRPGAPVETAEGAALSEAIVRVLKAGGQITDEMLAPLESEFSPPFFRRLRNGELDIVLKGLGELPVHENGDVAVPCSWVGGEVRGEVDGGEVRVGGEVRGEVDGREDLGHGEDRADGDAGEDLGHEDAGEDLGHGEDRGGEDAGEDRGGGDAWEDRGGGVAGEDRGGGVAGEDLGHGDGGEDLGHGDAGDDRGGGVAGEDR
ncbi:MAG: hypothetical protein LBQ79_10385, partial [Deltaproteobacteria bacterium]|nr:hypothetical protein [Deltaproteobacteria bacterium]